MNNLAVANPNILIMRDILGEKKILPNSYCLSPAGFPAPLFLPKHPLKNIAICKAMK